MESTDLNSYLNKVPLNEVHLSRSDKLDDDFYKFILFVFVMKFIGDRVYGVSRPQH